MSRMMMLMMLMMIMMFMVYDEDDNYEEGPTPLIMKLVSGQ